MKTKLLLLSLGLGGFSFMPKPLLNPKAMHLWLIEMHQAQIELLKINWGNPGLEIKRPNTLSRKDHR